MIRLGFGARLLLIVVTALVALQVLAVVVYFQQRSRDTATGFRLPVPDQAAALVELLERTPKAEWPLVLRAANSADLSVKIAEGAPRGAEPAWYEAPVVELIMQRYLAALGGRPVRVSVEASSERSEGPLRFLAWASPGAVEIEVGLKTGETLVVTTAGALTFSMLGFPPGFWAGLLGFAIALVTVLMLRREARPLRDLAAAVDRMQLPEKAEVIADAPRSAPEIRALISAFNRLGERVTSLLQARKVIASGISHDLRTYAARLRLRAELIADTDERAKVVRDLDDMSRLLDDSLLAFEARPPDREQQLFGIGPLLERETEDRRLAGSKVSLLLSDEAAAAEMLGDPLAIRRLIANLTDNAITYGGEASIAARVENGMIVITIDDKGPGIGAADRERVLEPFVRLEGSRNRKTGGAGLGLAIARKAAEQHGGTLSLKDSPSGGTRAEVRLPGFEAERSVPDR
ncbi:MAG: sensor histidine kinase [Hyphomicrobium sp.]|uniref:sensor histidine kinase n=1 Tax=Hyphomicrobium sp. TaxID=82 RepID=UPI003D0F58F4